MCFKAQNRFVIIRLMIICFVTIHSVTLTFCDTYIMCHKPLTTRHFVTLSFRDLTLCICTVQGTYSTLPAVLIRAKVLLYWYSISSNRREEEEPRLAVRKCCPKNHILGKSRTRSTRSRCFVLCSELFRVKIECRMMIRAKLSSRILNRHSA
jgi:hypothetical protein